MLANPYVRLTNNWLHDVATGLWAACLVVIAVLHGRIAGVDAVAAAQLASVTGLMFWMLVGSLVVITLTGVVRLVYWRSDTPAEELPSKRPALIGKHVAFLVVYGAGTVWAFVMAML